MKPLRGRYLILGLGVSGEAAAHALLDAAEGGAELSIAVVDSSDSETLRERAALLAERGVDVSLGADDIEGEFDTCVVSPGVPPTAPLMLAARASSTECISEIELAFRTSSSPWIAITGTNGKTTVTSLVAHLLRSSAIPAEVVGNIGVPATTVAAAASPGTAMVAEVSSFQLANIASFHPRVAVLLNITPDHLDWHGGLDEYIRDKARIFENLDADDTAVIDVDDPGSAAFANLVAATGVRVVRVSRSARVEGGAWVEGGEMFVDREGESLVLGPVRGLRIRGDHNVNNALAAACAALAFGADIKAIREGLASFKPIEHRLEPVAEIEGVEYFNDSKATNPDAVLKAVTAFADRRIVLLLGGRNKGNDFTPIAEQAVDRCRSVIVFGESAEEVAAAFRGFDVEVCIESGMLAAVERAHAYALPGDVVVLSPACASFDEFDDYTHRGRVFKDAILRRVEERGFSAGDGR